MSPTETPTVSVALCTFNGERYLREQLESILAQSHPVQQVVIADDGSTDGTLAIVEEVWRGRTSPELRVLPADDGGSLGVTANFERAVAATTGDLIVLSDQDDRWDPRRLAHVVARFVQSDAPGMIFGDARLVDAAGEPRGATLFDALEIAAADLQDIRGGDGFAVLLRRNLATGATMAFRRTTLELLLPFDRRWVHDEWIAILLAATTNVDYLADPLVDYRQHGGNQIGAAKPGFRRRLDKILESREGRSAGLADRVEAVIARLEGHNVPERLLSLARAKVAHERFRAALPRQRLLRVVPVLKHARTGAYDAFSSRRNLDIIRDLFQAP